MSSGPDLDLESTSSTGADASTGDASTGDAPCLCGDDLVALVGEVEGDGALPLISGALRDPALASILVLLIILEILRRLKNKPKPPAPPPKD